MAYLGNNLQVAFPSYRNIDDISGSFDGIETSFALTVDGVAPVPAPINSQQCLISVNGVVQRPDDSGTEGFRLSGGNIIFASAPAGGVDFFGVILAGADYVNVGADFPSGTASAPSITFDSDLDTGIYNPAGNEIGFTTGGTQRLVINSSGQISSGLGTAVAPAFSFISDPNTGIYSPGADQVAISTNGTGRLFVDASGNVGAGTGTPTGVSGSRVVEIYSSGTISELHLTNSTSTNSGLRGLTHLLNGADAFAYNREAGSYIFGTNNTERLRITSDGKLGLGTSAPQAQLQVNTSSSGDICQFATSAASGQAMKFGINTTDGLCYFRNNTSSNYKYAFQNTAGTSVLIIDNSGNVGVGTTSPQQKQHIHENSTAASLTQYTNSVTGSAGTDGFLVGIDSTEAGIVWVQENNHLAFGTNNQERGRFDSSGRLLVGTSSATAPAGEGLLEVNGLIRTAGISTVIESPTTTATTAVTMTYTLPSYKQALISFSSSQTASNVQAPGLYLVYRGGTGAGVTTVAAHPSLTSVTCDGSTGAITFTPNTTNARYWTISVLRLN